MDWGEIVGALIDYGVDVLVTTLDKTTGVIIAQLGDSSTNKADSNDAEWWQHAGLASRPALPTQGGASCQAIVLKKTDHDLIIATRDTRGTAIYGNLADGEACVYAPGAQGREMFKADGSVRAMTTDDNTKDGNAVWAGISSFYQGVSGPLKGGEWRVYAPWGGQWMDPTGWHLRTYTGVKIDAGGMGLPSPFGTVIGQSQLSFSADSGLLDFAMLSLGRNNGTGQALVQALPLQVVMSALGGHLSDAGAAITSASGAPDFATAAPFLVTAGAAITAAAGVIGAGTISPGCATKAITAS